MYCSTNGQFAKLHFSVYEMIPRAVNPMERLKSNQPPKNQTKFLFLRETN